MSLAATPISAPRESAPDIRQQALVASYEGLARTSVRRFLRRFRVPQGAGVDTDDLVGEALLALCFAARTWNPSRSAFATYASRAIHNRLLRACRLNRGSAMLGLEFTSLDSPAGDTGDECLRELVPDEDAVPDQQVCDTVFDVELRTAISELPQRDRSVLTGVLRGTPISVIARESGCSRQRIARIHDRALGRLRERLQAWVD